MSFLDNFRLFASTTGGNNEQSQDELMSRQDVKSKLRKDILNWRDKHREQFEDSVFYDKERGGLVNTDKLFDEWAFNKVKEKFGDGYGELDEEAIDRYEVEALNELSNKMKSNDFFLKKGEYDDEVKRIAATKYSYQNQYPAYRMAQKDIENDIKRGKYVPYNTAIVGINDYIKNIRGGVGQAQTSTAEPNTQSTPTEDDYVTINFAPGDTLGQKIIDAGLATDNGLWGENGDVAYYAKQIQLADPNAINAGSTFRLVKRK